MSVVSWGLLLLSGHPTPRRRRPPDEVDVGRFRCAAGPYADASTQRKRSAELQAHVGRAMAAGLLPTLLDATPRAVQNLSLFYTRESVAWPKPPRCRRRQAEVCEINPHFCLALPSGNSPRSSLVASKYHFEMRQVWKVASSSLASFFFCNMWPDLELLKVGPGTAPPRKADDTIVAFPSREPITRFIGAVVEVLARLLAHVSPGGQQMPDSMYVEPDGPMSAGLLARTTSWFEPLRRLNATIHVHDGQRLAASIAPEARLQALEDLVSGFISDLECSIIYSASEHLSSQASFVTSGFEALSHLDFHVRLSHIEEDLIRLSQKIGYVAVNASRMVEPHVDAGMAHVGWKCALGHENEASAKGKIMFVDQDDIAAVLRRSPQLVQRLCTVYMQDFVCLGYDLPPECQDGKELQWLEAAPQGFVKQSRSFRPGFQDRQG
mmetsp:Transcript_11697/g.32140  ORF Transcript_11697/g.32140 Transcript_11697/m.32140 type:complete len:437 (+) Transcript_11697:51-1361(+)